jgi:hypothetical protein
MAGDETLIKSWKWGQDLPSSAVFQWSDGLRSANGRPIRTLPIQIFWRQLNRRAKDLKDSVCPAPKDRKSTG